MTKRIQASDDVQIAALNKKREGAYDLMRPGEGTPWENRGQSGLLAAFFKTIARAMSAPTLLVDHIRRPETASDINAYVIGCGLALSLATLIQCTILYMAAHGNAKMVVDPTSFWEGAAVLIIIMPALWWLLVRIGCNAYKFLVTGDSKQKAPPVLYQNVLGYMASPIVLAVIPFGIGLTIGVLWMMILWIIAGRRRLYINPAATVIATIGSVLAMGIIGSAVVFGLYWLLGAYGVFTGAIAPLMPAPTAQ
jgi:hypothetical protein